MQLTLIRHGPTDWNAARRFQGRTDLPLSEQGRATARAVAAALRDEPFERLYSSDLRRAQETAEFLAAPRGLAVRFEGRLREFDFGRWEGLTWEQIVGAHPHLAANGSTAATRYAPEGGESFERVCARVRSFLDELAREPVESAAAVTHAGPLHAIAHVLGLGISGDPSDHLSLRFTPGGITQLQIVQGRATVLALDDRRHLDALG